MSRSSSAIAALIAAAVIAWLFYRNQSTPAGSVSVQEVATTDPYVSAGINVLQSMGLPIGSPRGIRNNNPGNLVYDVTQWVGLVGSDGRFCIFDTPENGIRAMQRVLNNYAARGVVTIRQVAATWAPAFENNVSAYVSALVADCGVGADQVPNRVLLIKGIIRHENGQQPYTDEQIFSGISAA